MHRTDTAERRSGGYIYLENGASGPRLDGVGRFDPPYAAMFRPITEAHLLFTGLDSGRLLHVPHFGEAEQGGSACLETDFTTPADDARRDIEARAAQATLCELSNRRNVNAWV